MSAALSVALVVAMTLLGLSLLLVGIRLLRGPSALDRLISLDVVVAELICVLVVWSALTDDSALVPVVVAVSLVGFLGSTTVGRFMGRSNR